MALEWGLPIASAVSGLFGGGGDEGREPPKPYWSGRRWAGQMAGKYAKPPELQLPGIGQEAVDLISRLMTGQLPTGVSQALGGGAERAYGAGLSGLADIGAGPATLAGMRGDIMGRLGEQKAMLGWQGMQAGLGAVPGISRLMMEPAKWGYEQQSQRWRDIAQMFLAQPGVAGLKEGQRLGGW